MLKAPGTGECHEAWVRGRGGHRRGSLGQSQSLTRPGGLSVYKGGPIRLFLVNTEANLRQPALSPIPMTTCAPCCVSATPAPASTQLSRLEVALTAPRPTQAYSSETVQTSVLWTCAARQARERLTLTVVLYGPHGGDGVAMADSPKSWCPGFLWSPLFLAPTWLIGLGPRERSLLGIPASHIPFLPLSRGVLTCVLSSIHR